MRTQVDVVFITADNTNVFNDRFFEDRPSWARHIRIQVVASDYDWLFSCSLGGDEMARDSGPHVVGADNLGIPDWRKPHLLREVPASVDFDVLVNVNVVTAGTGLVIGQWES